MPKERINPPSLFPSLQHGFSQIVATDGARTVYLSGQTAWDANKRIVGAGDLAEQTRQALRNVRTAVEAAGGAMDDVVSLRIYVVNFNPDEAEAISGPLKEFFQGETAPATTWIGVTTLAVKEFLIEIEAIAVLE